MNVTEIRILFNILYEATSRNFWEVREHLVYKTYCKKKL